MDLQLAGRRALVPGGTRGIGLGIARAMAGAGGAQVELVRGGGQRQGHRQLARGVQRILKSGLALMGVEAAEEMR